MLQHLFKLCSYCPNSAVDVLQIPSYIAFSVRIELELESISSLGASVDCMVSSSFSDVIFFKYFS